ncbi:Phosphate transporter 1 9 [Tripterygium wilfordii]|uniref:Phosphate transporter 1 9 n=1 Tax=Tripterygium wilfordii TaxID=458696 RepID=A0A7J7CYV3_TRIWF|nr:probable inorganic phosphate transporter 1-9 [Tripterygium wilfordii]KAF5739281.1 Phosphate transporter 1 9 [Tripterygium wilfordii]
MALKVLSRLDTARTQYYHFKAIIIAGMGLFSDAYDLFCIPPIMKILGRVYYENDSEIPSSIVSTLVGISLLGTVIGQLVFGRLGDKIGRRGVYGLSLMIMVLSSIACGFSICTTKRCVLGSLGFFRFFLGVGIGGDYPLSATIMSEFANKRTRGAFIAGVFSMQGFGILASSAVTMVVCAVFENTEKVEKDRTPASADIAWRLILMIGAIPAALTYYWRMMMPETARYTALVEQNVLQAAKDMEKVLEVPMSEIAEDSCPFPPPPPSYTLFSKEFLRRHGRDLFACAASWFLLDIVFYSNNLFQSQVYNHVIPKKVDVNVYRETFDVALLQAIVAAASTIPGYYFTVYFIDRIGRVKIQIMGFLCMALVYFAIGIPYPFYWNDHTNIGFMFLYFLTFFFANFGPNTTTFIVPAELFPARFRSTCHGISGAMGKVGALIGSIGFLWISKNGHQNGDPGKVGMTIALITLGGVSILGMIVTYLFTKETMGRSLEENENEEEEDNGFCFVRSLPKLSNLSCFSAGDQVSIPA